MSALPKAVKKQVDLANKIVDEVYDEDGNIRPPPQDPPKDQVDPPKDQVDPPKDPPKDPAPVDYEHKFRVLQGKYNAEVPRLQKSLTRAEASNQELSQRMLNLEGMLASIQAVKSAPPEPPAPSLPDITDDERAQFGDDLIDLIERTAARKLLPEIDTRVGKVDQHVKQVGEKVAYTETSVAESKRQQVFEALASAVPKWAEQNENPEFLEWLDQEEGMSGFTRGHFLTEAMKSNDAKKVIKYFTGFQSENAAATADPAPESTPAQEPAGQEPQVKLDELMAPGTPQTGTASAPNESGKRVWSREDIAKFYADRNEFVKKGKPIPKEMQKLERDLFSAQQEGRLR
jgi:hypothetical protein